MTQNGSTVRRSAMIRFLAGMAMVCAYFIGVTSVSSLLVAGTSTSAEARGGGRGGGCGGGRGRGWGGVGIIAPGCYYSPRWGRTICPY